MKKWIALLVVCLVVLMTGCDKDKDPDIPERVEVVERQEPEAEVSSVDFNSIAESAGDYMLVDSMIEYQDVEGLKAATSVVMVNGYPQIVYFEFEDAEKASDYYSTAVNNNFSGVESRKDPVVSEGSNFKSQELATGNMYLLVEQVGKTVLVVNTETTYRDQVLTIIKELGY